MQSMGEGPRYEEVCRYVKSLLRSGRGKPSIERVEALAGMIIFFAGAWLRNESCRP